MRYGVTYRDVLRIKETIPNVRHIVPLRSFRVQAGYAYVKHRVKIMATVPNYRLVGAVSVIRGRFFGDLDEERMTNTCVVTEALARRGNGELVRQSDFASVPRVISAEVERLRGQVGRPKRRAR